MKTGKAADFDCMCPELLVQSGRNVRVWFSEFMPNVMVSNELPAILKKTKIITMLKSVKSSELPESYRPIALLSVTLKILERLIYNRVSPVIEEIVPPEQTGSRHGRSCIDQVLALANFIETGFQKKLKMGVIFVYLTAAFVWKKGFFCKFLKDMKSLTLCDLLSNMLSDKIFQVFLQDGSSSLMKLNDDLSHGSILSPILFNLFMADLPSSSERKFIYANDIACAIQK